MASQADCIWSWSIPPDGFNMIVGHVFNVFLHFQLTDTACPSPKMPQVKGPKWQQNPGIFAALSLPRRDDSFQHFAELGWPVSASHVPQKHETLMSELDRVEHRGSHSFARLCGWLTGAIGLYAKYSVIWEYMPNHYRSAPAPPELADSCPPRKKGWMVSQCMKYLSLLKMYEHVKQVSSMNVQSFKMFQA